MEYKDLAARVQADFETALLQRFKLALEKCPGKNVVYSGGIALNCVANQRLRRELGLENFFVLPASSDAGISLGAAAAAHFVLSGEIPHLGFQHHFWGFRYGEREYRHALQYAPAKLECRKVGATEVADLLARDKILGVFDGPLQFGPRALGHRSILANPREKSMWTFINRRIKFREDFRPFAPMVPAERAQDFFEAPHALPFMLETAEVRPDSAISEPLLTLTAPHGSDGGERESFLDRFHLDGNGKEKGFRFFSIRPLT